MPEPVSEDFAVEAKFPLRRDRVRTEKDAEQTGQKYPTHVSLWQIPAVHDMREFWAETGSEPYQNKKSKYPKSCLDDGNRQVHYFPSSLFSYVHKPTQIKFDRSWLCYSDYTNKIFCFDCTLFASDVSDNLFSCGGFSNWKNVQQTVTVHEKSADHLESLEKYITLQTEHSRIERQYGLRSVMLQWFSSYSLAELSKSSMGAVCHQPSTSHVTYHKAQCSVRVCSSCTW